MINSLNRAKSICEQKPVAVIANTNKGNGVSYMIGNGEWHGKAPGDHLYETAINELNNQLKEVREDYAILQE